jgi:cob(I)alamin adenosyltransferase
MTMVTLNRIYTRGGDQGETSLGNGDRVDKNDLRIEAYGTVDEVNSLIGIIRFHLSNDTIADKMLNRIQNDLFDLGADLCIPQKNEHDNDLRIVQSQVDRLEKEIDKMNEKLQPLNSFVLPGGTLAAAYLHQARTVTRRAERILTSLSRREMINPCAISYINRLSDHLFVMSRMVNKNGELDVLWVPGASRTQ